MLTPFTSRNALRLSIPALIGFSVALTPLTAFSQGVKLQPAHKSQSELAAKTKFQVVKANAKELKGALEAHDIAGAKKLIGKDGGFYGTVDNVFETSGHSVVLLDFDKNYKTAVVAALLPAHFHDLPDMKQLKAQKVLVTGKWLLYQSRPEIIVSSVGQIKIVK